MYLNLHRPLKMQGPQTPIPNPPANPPHPNATHYPTIYLQQLCQNPNSIPNPEVIVPLEPQKPHFSTGVGPYSSSVGGGSGGYNAYTYHQTADACAVVGNYGSTPFATVTGVSLTIPPHGTDQLIPALVSPQLLADATVQLHRNGPWNKTPKKTKIVQSVWCEVCKIACNSQEVHELHKLGKKHKKNLEKLHAASAPPPIAPGVLCYPIMIGPQENPQKGKSSDLQKSRKRVAKPVEDLETKRRKVLQGGAALDAVKTCAICNVVCNSERVFQYHLAGRKHASMMQKQADAIAGVANIT